MRHGFKIFKSRFVFAFLISRWLCAEQIAHHRFLLLHKSVVFEHTVEQGPEFELFKNFLQLLDVGGGEFHLLKVGGDGDVGLDGGQKTRKADLFGVFLYFSFHGAFQFVGAAEQLLDGAELTDELDGRLFAHAGTARNVVGRVAHEAEQVNHLFGRLQRVFGLHLLGAELFERSAAACRAAHGDVRRHELGVVLVGRHHVGVESGGGSLAGHGADDVVGLVAAYLENGDAVGLNNLFDDGYRQLDVLRRGFTLGLVGRVGLVAERGAAGVEGYGQIVGLFLADNFFQRIDKAHDGRRVAAFGVYARSTDKGIVSPVDQRIGIE